ncbi:N-acetylglucosamine/diacetylchitobiose ABC transporter substrate-binding protein [Brachybacterium phenoliresistens]|uniref:N-acetylglucosamine/diacetylchitobiose ABC transporter substrate-binding protein n=1 Tax=Brachybacterium phenoliresistens TaxID=396014 RepID=UPI0031D731F7
MEHAHDDALLTPADRLALSRRRFMTAASATAGVAALSACAGGGGGGAPDAPADGGGEKSDDNPFGVAEGSTVDVVIFDGGYGDEYAIAAGKAMEELHPGVTVEVNSTVNIGPELQPRFVGGNPPDVFDNSGAQSMDTEALISEGQLAELDALLEAPSIDGGTVGESLLPGATDPGTYSGSFLAMNYVYTVYALWYSQKQFDDNGWSVPTTWDELMALGETVKAAGSHLFSYGGQNASTYYQELALSMAVKQGGVEVAKNIDRLEPDAFAQDAVVQAYAALEEAVKAGFFVPGGAGVKHTQAQTDWVTGKSVMYPSGSWIENEQRDVTPEDYALTGAPVPLLGEGAALPLAAIHGTAGEPFMVPSQGKNAAGGLEFLRVMLSQEQATQFTALTGSPTVVQGAAPDPADASTALTSTLAMIEAAGADTFNYNFSEWYGLGADNVTLWTEFLDGRTTADQLREKQQALIDAVREDDTVTKFDVP